MNLTEPKYKLHIQINDAYNVPSNHGVCIFKKKKGDTCFLALLWSEVFGGEVWRLSSNFEHWEIGFCQTYSKYLKIPLAIYFIAKDLIIIFPSFDIVYKDHDHLRKIFFYLTCDFLFAVPYNQLNIIDYIAFFHNSNHFLLN